MSKHEIHYQRRQSGWFVFCECRASGGTEPLRSAAEDWGYAHLQQVQRARAHLHGRAPSLRDQYLYYRQMETDSATPSRDRALWKALADGLEHRLGVTTGTPSLFEETG